MIKRYMDTANRGHIEWPTGEWVKHEDAAALESKIAELQSALDVQSACSDALAVECESKKTALTAILEHCPVNHPHIDAAVAAMIAHDNLYCVKTPATDAWVNEQRAVGADLTKQQIEAAIKSCYQDEQIGLIEAAEVASSFAAQLRGSQV